MGSNLQDLLGKNEEDWRNCLERIMNLMCEDCSMGPCVICIHNATDPTDFTDCPAILYSGQDSGVTWKQVD